MGWRLVGYFKQAEEIGGISGKVQLASITRVTSTEAESIEDTPELRSRFEGALARVRARFIGDESSRMVADVPTAGDSDAERLRRHIRSYLELMSQRE